MRPLTTRMGIVDYRAGEMTNHVVSAVRYELARSFLHGLCTATMRRLLTEFRISSISGSG